MSSNEPVIDVRGVGKRYDIYNNPRDRLKQLVMPKLTNLFGRSGPAPTYHREFWALHDISFQVRPGETLGIIGRNGGGKSTLLQILAGTLAPTLGDLTVKGRVAALLELGSGFNPDFTGRENVLLNARILGLSSEQIDASYDEIVAFADIGDFIDQPVKTYSSGMFVRLAFAVQAHINASIVIIDEALAVGDVFFRQKCYARLEEIRSSGAAVLLVSHAMTDIEQFCDRAILLDHGRMNFLGDAAEAAKRYYQLHQTGQSFSTTSYVNKSEATHADQSDCEEIKSGEFTSLRSAETITQVGNGSAECLGFSVYDTQGAPCHHFSQGQVAVFVSEFRILKDIGMATCGVVLHNERGITVHGKGSIEHGVGTGGSLKAGNIVRCKQEISLNLQLGEYTFEIGLGSIDPDIFSRMSEMTHEAIDASVIHLCVLPNAGSLSIGWASNRSGSALSHHGIADLPGSIEFSFPDLR
ncbi:lipopolysaccharide transport system ATP-binding protein [Rhizobium skierniewicense]|uniref:Lipopolysaccharide transport system ATP-binding protein n=1 Tax=Rhizobium skierniewicense TaxID=984260 RepID=A0A7W6C624_9HYPH|nr:ABC transporter ATP-binding protein [Rhizobium skierniewicense]MBB3944608.1 lipopolysaccharide transport system ATP-binding protein [Rhizobium skierniewicense]